MIAVGGLRTFEEADTVDASVSSETGRYKGVFNGLLEGGDSVFAQQLAVLLDAPAEIGLR